MHQSLARHLALASNAPVRQWRLFYEWLLIALGASLIVLLAVRSDALNRADRLIYDLVSPFYAPPTNNQILIAAIDNDALAAIGRWPWPRHIHANAINAVTKAQPAAIIYDVLFIEPSSEDAQLAEALKTSGATYLPLLYEVSGANGAAYSIRQPIEPLTSSAAGSGTVNLQLDSDGQTRSITIASQAREGAASEGSGQDSSETHALPHVAELAYRHVTGHASPAYERTAQTGEPLHIAFRPAGSFRSVSLLNIVRGEVPPAFLRDKIVIVGATAEGMGDMHPVSSARGGLMAGAEVQANLLSSLFADRFITYLPSEWILPLSLAPFWLLLIAFWRLTPTQGLILSITVTILIVLTSALILALRGVWIPPIAALLGIAIVYPLWGWRRLASVSKFMESEVDALLTATGMGEPKAAVRDWRGDRVESGASRLHQVIAVMQRNAQEREEVLQFLSHDMRSPQAAIIALVESETGKQQDHSLLSRIRHNAERTLQLADNFVQLARIGSRGIEKEPVDIADAMAQAADNIWPQVQAKQHKLIRESGDAGLLWVEGDAAALVRAFSNLLANAVQASPKGSMIHCGVIEDAGYALAYVRDNGPGLPSERRGNPFARFGYSSYQGDVGEQGSGLGLAYVDAVARQHGGEAYYQDVQNGGAQFIMRIKLAVDLDIDGEENLSP